MAWRQGLLVLGAALLAGCLGLLASVAVYGPGPLLASLPAGWFDPPTPPGVRSVSVGDAMPSLRLADLDGRWHTLPPPGRPVLINYWASWCGPCREEMPLLAAQSARPGAPMVVGIALDDRNQARRFLESVPVPFRVLVEDPGVGDSSVILGNRRGVLPYSVLVDATGRVRRTKLGAFDDAAELTAWLAGQD